MDINENGIMSEPVDSQRVQDLEIKDDSNKKDEKGSRYENFDPT
jgi:hypothetical protein